MSELPEHVHLDGLAIDETDGVLLVGYSEPDQGGTRLLLCYRVPVKGPREAQPWLESGYTFDMELSRHTMPWEDMPSRLKTDAERWLVEQIEKAEESGKTSLAEKLSLYLRTVTEGAA